MNNTTDVQHKLDAGKLRQVLPQGPGVYLFKDVSGAVIYVGKAKNLKKRVLSYFTAHIDPPYKTTLMMKRAFGVDFLVTSTEQEAFILESNLIKKFMPRYNIILRDDKQYPCLRLNIREPYPRLRIIRKIKKDGALYFGPFSSAHSVRSTLKLIDRVFKLRKCKSKALPKRSRPCINYQMGQCLGPCTHDMPGSKYREIVHQVRLFLEGRNSELIERLKKDMAAASSQMDFEKAAGLRDQIRAIEKTVERQYVVSQRLEDQDIIGLAQKDRFYRIVILFVRKGYLMGSRNYSFNQETGPAVEVMEAFLKQYYSSTAFIPKQILISEAIEDLEAITKWLCDLAGTKVVIHRPIRGEKFRRVMMAVTNAENLVTGYLKDQTPDLMNTVRSVLRLKKVPRFIEGLDISNLQGVMAVGSVVSFVDGKPQTSGYRNYRIRAVDSIDDYGMMEELVEKRLVREPLPDLFLVDGGKGHLSAVKKILDRQGRVKRLDHNNGARAHSDLPEMVAIAKADQNRNEKCDRLYIPGRKNALRLKADHPVLLLMIRIRDEAHRRAISYHRYLRGKDLTESDLDFIPGIGIKRKKLLLKHFKDIRAVAEASPEALSAVPGISTSLGNNIFLYFRGNKIQPKPNKPEELEVQS